MLNRDRVLAMMCAAVITANLASARAVDPNKFSVRDFAAEVIYYEPGDDVNTPGSLFDPVRLRFYDRKAAALGAPTRSVRLKNGDYEWVNPVLPVADANDLVSIGTTYDPCRPAGIVLKFDHRVADDSRNPYGLDFIVFGNALYWADTTDDWVTGTLPTSRTIVAFYDEPGIVSVAQYADGPWYTFASPLCGRADSFAPTASRKWDPVEGRWGAWLDPTRPIDPNLKPSDFYGKTVAEAIDMYDGSAGGAGFDISVFGLAWIQYVKIEQDPDLPYVVIEVDAVSDVAAPGDVNYDLCVDLKDFAVIASGWTGDFGDLSEVSDNWLAGAGGAM